MGCGKTSSFTRGARCGGLRSCKKREVVVDIRPELRPYAVFIMLVHQFSVRMVPAPIIVSYAAKGTLDAVELLRRSWSVVAGCGEAGRGDDLNGPFGIRPKA